jgi:hypothetical protein
MLVQADYETEATLAVLQSQATTEAAIERLHRIGIPADAIQRAQVPPDTYQILDTSADDALDAIVRGASIGVPLGALVGVSIGALTGLAGPIGFGFLAVIGAAMGAIIGSIFGAAAGAKYDDDPIATIDLHKVTTAEVLSVHTHSHRATLRARHALKGAGALALLDPTLFSMPVQPARVQ